MRAPAVTVTLLALALATPSAGQERPQERLVRGAGFLTQTTLEELAARARADVEAIRGEAFLRPVAVELVDPASFEDLARRHVQRDLDSVDTDEIVAKLLGMIPGDMDLLEVSLGMLQERVGGFYDPETETCYVVESTPSIFAQVVLAHALALAHDHQHHGPREPALSEPNTDQTIASQALFAGSGLELLSRWEIRNRERIQHEQLAVLAREAVPVEILESAPPFVWKPRLAALAQGQSFLRRQARRSILGSPALLGDLELAFTNPPRSTEQILHPVKFWDPDRVDEPRVVTCDTSGLPQAWNVLREDTFGELYAAILTTPFEDRGGMDVSDLGLLGLRFTNAAASGWGGDRFVLLERDGGYFLRMCLRWDSAADAREFHAALRELRPRIESAVAAVPGSDPELRGLRVERGAEDEVLVTAWMGLEPALVERAVGAIRFAAE